MTLAVLYGIGVVLSYSQGFLMATVTQGVSKKIRSRISGKINTLPMNYYSKTTIGEVLSRVTNDVDAIGESLNRSVGTLVSAICMLVGSLVMMLATNLVLTVAAGASSILGFGLLMLIMGRSQKYFLRQQKHLGHMNGHVEEIYAGHTVVSRCQVRT